MEVMAVVLCHSHAGGVMAEEVNPTIVEGACCYSTVAWELRLRVSSRTCVNVGLGGRCWRVINGSWEGEAEGGAYDGNDA